MSDTVGKIVATARKVYIAMEPGVGDLVSEIIASAFRTLSEVMDEDDTDEGWPDSWALEAMAQEIETGAFDEDGETE